MSREQIAREVVHFLNQKGANLYIAGVSCADDDQVLKWGIVKLPAHPIRKVLRKLSLEVSGAHIKDPTVIYILSQKLEKCKDLEVREALAQTEEYMSDLSLSTP